MLEQLYIYIIYERLTVVIMVISRCDSVSQIDIPRRILALICPSCHVGGIESTNQ